MKPTPRRIISLWKQNAGWKPSLTEIRQALGIKKNQTTHLRDILEKMLSNGALLRSGHRFVLAVEVLRTGGAAPGSEKASHSNKTPAGKKAPADNGSRPSAAQEPQVRKSPVEFPQEEGFLGLFSAHPNGFAFVEPSTGGESAFIPPHEVAGALDGDWVMVDMVPDTRRGRPYGRVREVVKRRRERVRGHLSKEFDETWVVPLNRRLPMVYLPDQSETADIADQTLVEVAIIHFPEHSDEAPEGRLVAVLESDLEPEQVVRHIIADTGLTTEFSRGTHAEMERLPASPDISSGQGRVDLRNRLFVTIDGKDARDFDDAVCLEAMENGNWRLLVSIADVAEYVLPGTAVDDDAYRKGTSVYFPGQVYPMLPHALSNDLCSLKPRVPRLCLTCEMELTAGGQRVGHRIFESTIRSQARLTYGQVQQYFDTGTRGTLTGPVAAMLAEMRRLAKVLRDKRSKRGSLDFTFPEYRFDLDQKGYPKRINVFYPNEATRLIEQLMLEANEAVAWEASRLELPILYRVHDPPPGDLVDDLLLKLWNFGLSASREDLLSSPGLKGILAQARDNPRFEQIELAVLKSLSQARYREENSGHFALGAEHYTHFTSPIRRYPDLLLHRALKSHIRKRPEPPALPANAGLALSTLERIASEAEQRVNRLYKVMFMEKHVGEVFNGTVTGLSERGVQLSLDEYPVDGWLPSEKIPGPRLRYDRRKDILTASGRRPVKLGDRLSVQLNRADRLTQELDFSLISWGEKKSRKPEK